MNCRCLHSLKKIIRCFLAHITKTDGTNIAIGQDIPNLNGHIDHTTFRFSTVVLTPNNRCPSPESGYRNRMDTSSSPRLFPQYRVALADFPSDDLYIQILITMMPIVLTGVLGFIAIFGAWKADKKKMELIERQQEFIARVTHELKTPLAGIQLMAESMQMTDHEDIKPFIEKILKESTRLGNRIDEVLQVAKDTEINKRFVWILKSFLLKSMISGLQEFKKSGEPFGLNMKPARS